MLFWRALLIVIVVSLTISIPSLLASSFPGPGNNPETSMIGVCLSRSDEESEAGIKGRIAIELAGPKSLRFHIGDEEWEVVWIKADPGTYLLSESSDVTLSQGLPDRIEVPAGSIILAPFVLERGSYGVRTTPLNEEIRQRAGRDLVSYVDFPVWSDRTLIGFGALRPAVDTDVLKYNIAIRSGTPDSEVYVDDLLVGMAPLDFALTSGKHRILIRAENHEDAIYYIRLEGDAEINAELVAAEAELESDGTERYRTLVGPFLTFDEPDNQLARLFADTLLLALESDPRLEPVPAAIPWTRQDALVYPDYLPLEEVGADLVVSGFFGMQDGRLTVQANLYDVQAETIRATVTWLGTAGFDIFDAMDEIALEFTREVDRVLPEAGRTLVKRWETVYQGVDRNTGLLARKKIMRKRWEENPNTLTLRSGIGGMFETIPVTGSISTSEEDRFDGPYIPITLKWDRDLSSVFAMGAGMTVFTGRQRTENSSDTGDIIAMGGLFGGPRLIFRSLRADIVLSMDIQIIYAPELTFSWDEGTPDSGDAGPFIYLNLPLEISFRYYFSNRIDRMPFFIASGFGVSPIGYRFDTRGRGQSGMIGADFSLNIGMGIRL